MSPRDLSIWEAWQEPPAFLDAPLAGSCACLDGAVVVQAPYPPSYDSAGLLLGSTVVGFFALRALGRVHRQMAADLEVEAQHAAVTVVAPDVTRSKSGVEAKGDVEAHTARGKRRAG